MGFSELKMESYKQSSLRTINGLHRLMQDIIRPELPSAQHAWWTLTYLEILSRVLIHRATISGGPKGAVMLGNTGSDCQLIFLEPHQPYVCRLVEPCPPAANLMHPVAEGPEVENRWRHVSFMGFAGLLPNVEAAKAIIFTSPTPQKYILQVYIACTALIRRLILLQPEFQLMHSYRKPSAKTLQRHASLTTGTTATSHRVRLVTLHSSLPTFLALT